VFAFLIKFCFSLLGDGNGYAPVIRLDLLDQCESLLNKTATTLRSQRVGKGPDSNGIFKSYDPKEKVNKCYKLQRLDTVGSVACESSMLGNVTGEVVFDPIEIDYSYCLMLTSNFVRNTTTTWATKVLVTKHLGRVKVCYERHVIKEYPYFVSCPLEKNKSARLEKTPAKLPFRL